MCGVISNFSTWQMWRFLRFIQMWRNFRFLHTVDVEKYEISPYVACVWCKNVNTYTKFKLFCQKKSFFFAIYAILSQNCYVLFYALLCGEKFIQKLHYWRKNDKYGVSLWTQNINIWPHSCLKGTAEKIQNLTICHLEKYWTFFTHFHTSKNFYTWPKLVNIAIYLSISVSLSKETVPKICVPQKVAQ